jgi:hypothetical protein
MGLVQHDDGMEEQKDSMDCSRPSDLLATQAKSWVDEGIAFDSEPSPHVSGPRMLYDHGEAGAAPQLEMNRQQRQERLEELIHVFASIFAGLSPEQRARYMSGNIEQEAA